MKNNLCPVMQALTAIGALGYAIFGAANGQMVLAYLAAGLVVFIVTLPDK